MKVKLINKPTLDFVDSGVGMCWGKGAYGADTTKGFERIVRVCNKNKHNSMLRFANYIFVVELSTSALLELSRHQIGVNLAVMSSRYCIHNSDIKFEMSNNDKVNNLLKKHYKDILGLLREEKVDNDDFKLLLPQAYIYTAQIQFNAQSLQHFLELRTAKGVHYHIQQLARVLYEELPENHKELFKPFVYSKEDEYVLH